MNEGASFSLKGNIVPVPGPGFSTPTFQQGNSNGLWIQDIDAEDRVVRFLELAPPLVEESRTLEYQCEQHAGAPAIYVFHGRETSYIDTRPGLIDALRYEYELLEDFPYLRRSIGRFVDDEALTRRANEQITEWTQATPKFGTRPWSEVRERFMLRRLYDEVANRARSGVPLCIYGRRGSGKTSLLLWLAEELKASKRNVYRVPVRPNNSIVPALFELGTEMPNWTLEARDRAREYAKLLRAGEPTDHAATEAVHRFANACYLEKWPTILLLDDFDVSLEDPAAGAANRALLDLVRSSGSIQIIASVGLPHFVPPNHDLVQIGRDFSAFELPDLDRSEIEQLFRRVGDPRKGDLDDHERVSLGHRLAGFNFREVLHVLAQVATSSDKSEDAIRRIISDRCDMIHGLVREISPKVDLLLGAITPETPQSSFVIITGEAERDPDLRRALFAAMHNGLVKCSEDKGIRFQHRYVRDWWEARRSTRR